ncbi:hypothetical protein [Rhodococcus pyridinivorans]|uniref:hypothetical protein n=1 Tax=Rhodococcus pyridinivorans TaxID=103816 RepID=UPI0020C76F3B|nr:hypothetical protein [Rhodococcus pyridinivorans]
MTVGVVAHLLGDAGTKMGVPLLAPLVSINGKRWWDVAPPSLLRIKASGVADQVLLGVFTVASLVLLYLVVVDPASLGASWA